MRRKLPPLNALLAFDAVVKHRSFTAAARAMNVAQPAVSRHVANLEAWLDLRLFDRGGSAPRLTDAGAQLADTVEASFDRLELGIQTLPRTGRNEIVIGASFGIMHLWLMPRLAAMRAATTATVNFVTSDSYEDFEGAAVDASIQFSPTWPKGWCSDFLFAEQCYVVASPAFLDAHPTLDPARLADTLNPDWLLDHGDPQNAGWMTWRIWFDLQGVRRPAPNRWREVRNYPAMLDMVRHGEGVAIGSVGLDDDLVEAGAVRRLGPMIGRPEHGYRLVYSPQALEKPGFADLRQVLIGAS